MEQKSEVIEKVLKKLHEKVFYDRDIKYVGTVYFKRKPAYLFSGLLFGNIHSMRLFIVDQQGNIYVQSVGKNNKAQYAKFISIY